MKAEIGKQVKAYRGTCIGVIIQASTWQGIITKVNKKSIRVTLTEQTCTYGRKVTFHRENMSDSIRYNYWKTTDDGRELYTSEGRLYGIIEL